jgi:hypothetical protein
VARSDVRLAPSRSARRGFRPTPPLGRPRAGGRPGADVVPANGSRSAPPLPRGRAPPEVPTPAFAGQAGGADRVRTGDPLVANQVLSQLSYSPGSSGLVGLSGFEPLTSRLSAVRSSQLSYRPVVSGPRHVRGRGSRGAGSQRAFARPGGRGGWLPENWVDGGKRQARTARVGSFRKEVIQPQVLLQLPCYDFTPITDHTVGACLPCGLARRLLVQPAFVM